MKRNLYVIKDLVAEESGPIFEAVNDGIAHRRFKALMAEQTHEWFVESDYQLLQIGEINKITNLVTGIEPREVITKLSLLEDIENAESV